MEKNAVRGARERKLVPVRLSYTVFDPEGTPTVVKPPIIFLHGITSCKEVWRNIPQLVANETKRKAYTYDARNHGDSEWSDEFNIEIMVRDLLFFMDSIKATTAILIGHSMGGLTAINAALMKPERIEMLIVEDMSVTGPPEKVVSLCVDFTVLAPKALSLIPNGADENEAMQIIMSYINQNTLMEKTQRQFQSSQIDPISMGLRKLSDGSFELKANMPVLTKALKTGKKTLLKQQGCYKGPACFIYGKLSPFQVLADSKKIEKHFPEVVFTGIENSCHSVHSDSPQDFLKAVVEFIADHEMTLIEAEQKCEMDKATLAQSTISNTQNIQRKQV